MNTLLDNVLNQIDNLEDFADKAKEQSYYKLHKHIAELWNLIDN